MNNQTAKELEFARFLGHELRNPLTSMKLYAEMLLKDLSESKQEEQIEMIQKINQQIDSIKERISFLTSEEGIKKWQSQKL